MNVNVIVNLIRAKTGKQPQSRRDDALVRLREFLQHPDIADYLRHCVPDDIVGASDIRILPLDAIEQEMADGVAPGSFIRPYGYLVVATSIGGNAVCFHLHSGKVCWADHDSFSSDCISYKDRSSGEWKYLYEYTPANVEKALVLLSPSIERFLIDLLSDRLMKQLEALN
jgi:hypothetical protein